MKCHIPKLNEDVDFLVRRLFFEKTNQQYEVLKKDTQAWKEELDKREEWDVTLLDGLNLID